MNADFAKLLADNPAEPRVREYDADLAVARCRDRYGRVVVVPLETLEEWLNKQTE